MLKKISVPQKMGVAIKGLFPRIPLPFGITLLNCELDLCTADRKLGGFKKHFKLTVEEINLQDLIGRTQTPKLGNFELLQNLKITEVEITHSIEETGEKWTIKGKLNGNDQTITLYKTPQNSWACVLALTASFQLSEKVKLSGSLTFVSHNCAELGLSKKLTLTGTDIDILALAELMDPEIVQFLSLSNIESVQILTFELERDWENKQTSLTCQTKVNDTTSEIEVIFFKRQNPENE